MKGKEPRQPKLARLFFFSLCDLELARDFAVGTTAKTTNGVVVNILGNESDRTIAHQCVRPADVQTERFVIWTAVIIRPRASGWSAHRTFILIDDAQIRGVLAGAAGA